MVRMQQPLCQLCLPWAGLLSKRLVPGISLPYSAWGLQYIKEDVVAFGVAHKGFL